MGRWFISIAAISQHLFPQSGFRFLAPGVTGLYGDGTTQLIGAVPMPADREPGEPSPINLEDVLAHAPMVVRRRIKWGEIDFARIVYTARFLDFALDAAEVWFTHVAGEHWAAFDLRWGVTVPVMACHLNFHHALHPNDQLDLTVYLDRIGRSSHTLRIEGHNQHRDHCFDSEITFATVDPDRQKSVPMPDDFVQRLDAYKKACESN